MTSVLHRRRKRDSSRSGGHWYLAIEYGIALQYRNFCKKTRRKPNGVWMLIESSSNHLFLFNGFTSGIMKVKVSSFQTVSRYRASISGSDSSSKRTNLDMMEYIRRSENHKKQEDWHSSNIRCLFGGDVSWTIPNICLQRWSNIV